MGDEISTTVYYKSMYVTILGIAIGALSKNQDNQTKKKIGLATIRKPHPSLSKR